MQGGHLPCFPRGGSWDTALAVLKPRKSQTNQDELVRAQGNRIPLVGQDQCFEKEKSGSHSEVHYCGMTFFRNVMCVYACKGV